MNEQLMNECRKYLACKEALTDVFKFETRKSSSVKNSKLFYHRKSFFFNAFALKFNSKSDIIWREFF